MVGYFELTDSGQQMSAQQVQIVKDHLDLVFKKETPNYTSITSYIQPYYEDGSSKAQVTVFNETPQVSC